MGRRGFRGEKNTAQRRRITVNWYPATAFRGLDAWAGAGWRATAPRPRLSREPAGAGGKGWQVREVIAMDRRGFIASAAGAGATLATVGSALANEEGAAMTRRFAEQRWA